MIKNFIPLKLKFYIKKIVNVPMRYISDIILKNNNKKKIETIKSKIKNNIPLKVGFILQYPEMWNSLKSIYEYMNSDMRFDYIVLTIPKRDAFKDGKAILKRYNDASEFCDKNSVFYKEINLNDPVKDLVDIDYVFLQRPYSDFLPPNLSLSNISKYAIICYVPYGYEFVNGIHLACEYNEDFLNNMTYCFVEGEETYNYVYRQRKYEFNSRLKKLYNIGYPRFDQVNRMNKPSKIKRVIWTPRWSLSEENDRSFFFDYYEILTKYMEKHLDITLVIRPHPLMFTNFIETGRLTIEEVDKIKKDIEKQNNVSLDMNKDYKITFENSDILISDFSSLLIEYFVTNRPIIYCGGNLDTFNNVGKRMSQGFYHVSNKYELVETLDSLLYGQDKLFLQRKGVADSILKNCGNAGKQIAKTLYESL